MKCLFAIYITLVLSGCADSHQLIRNDSSTTKLISTDTIFISVPEDGFYGSDIYRSSGKNTAQILRSAFAKHTRTATVGRSTQNFDQALTSAKQAGKNYLVYPTILHWEDRATEWSAIPDRVEVKIDVINTTSGNTTASGIVKAKSGLATFGGDHPQDLLPQPIEEFVSSLY